MLRQSTKGIALGPHSVQDTTPPPASPAIGTTFEGFNFDDNGTETSSLFIPPDPIGAAGTDSLIAVVNVMIEARDKTGTLLWRDSLKDFFTTLTPVNWLYDPKVIYDHYENRFLVVALEHTDTYYGDPSNTSRILLAVSKTDTPATATSADWYYTAINAKENIGGVDCWADYPGFEVDEEAVYITSNMFQFISLGGGWGGVRLRIVDKGVTGGFYAGSAASVTTYDPYAGGGNEMTTMPAQVYGAGGIDGGGAGGTYLVGYSGLTNGGVGGNEYVQVVRVNNPLGATTFTQTYVLVGDIEDVGGIYGWPDLPDAPQLGSATGIEVNDQRALDAVWRNNQLWLTTTINPNSGPDAGQTTAHWFRLDTSAWPPTLGNQGDIGGEDIATNTYTFFPALAVNNNGDVKFGFCASAATIYAGAYATVHLAGDAPGTVQASETVRAGDDYYVRHFTGTRNRWGDYTGAALDPTDDNVVWLFNQYAMTRGSGTPPEDGRWGTAWASNLFTTAIAPTVTTNAATLVEETTATLNGDITDTGGENCDYRGFVWGDESHSNPGDTAPASSGYDSYWSESGSYGTGTFNHGIASLSEGTKYYCRACARNSGGWSYGSELTFLTKPDAPTGFSATAAGNTQIDLSWTKGDGAQKTRIQRKEGGYPTDRNDGTQVYFDTGTSTPDTGLTPGTTYYYRAWSYVTGSEQWSDGYAEGYATTTQPDITVSPTSFNKSLPSDTTQDYTLTISNDGDGDLSYNISDGGCPWLSESPTSGTVGPGASHNITVTINTTGLADGDYSAEIVIASNDPDENPKVVPVTLHVGLSSYNITLSSSWNLVSLPVIPDNTSIANVTAAINTTVSIIWYYNANTATWLWYVPGNPVSTLSTIEDGKGYWFLMNSPDALEGSGWSLPGPGAPAAYDVFVGWNLIGFTSMASMSPESYLATIAGVYSLIYGWDAEGQAWLWYVPGNPSSTLTTMEPGYGYWLLATADGTIVPPA